jgi:L-asparaginase/Glu-tRNA(Gln) amidotransferase subunit D
VASTVQRETLIRLLDAAGGRIPEFELVQEALPRGGDFEFDVRRPVGMLSENLAPEDWTAMATSIRGLVEDKGVDAILILHGTDTMAYTSS